MINRWRLAFGAVLGLALSLGGAVAVSQAEILPVARERLQEAEQLGRTAVKDDAILFTGTCRTMTKHGLYMFDVTITTPFASMAYAVFDSKKKGLPFDLTQWPIQPPEKQSVIISADPAVLLPADLPPALPINVARVVLRRGEQILEAARADTHQVLFPDADEKHRKYRGGTFYFPLEPFASELGDLEILVIPEIDQPGAEAVLKLKKATLAKLR